MPISSIAHPDGVVAGARDDEAVVVLQAGDAPLVPVERPHKLAGAGSRKREKNSAIILHFKLEEHLESVLGRASACRESFRVLISDLAT